VCFPLIGFFPLIALRTTTPILLKLTTNRCSGNIWLTRAPIKYFAFANLPHTFHYLFLNLSSYPQFFCLRYPVKWQFIVHWLLLGLNYEFIA